MNASCSTWSVENATKRQEDLKRQLDEALSQAHRAETVFLRMESANLIVSIAWLRE
jgi:hypothetical protein